MNLPLSIRIGTRDSKLALWQAARVKERLEQQGVACTLVPVKSEGDLDLVTPLYAMGVEGVFTKTLDAHLLSDRIDIAVHSMKDVPTQLAAGLVQAAVLERGNYKDILIARNATAQQRLLNGEQYPAVIATGSIRRKAQWLRRYPGHRIENLRGNVQTRMQKLQDNEWEGAIFAAAGLERMAMAIPYSIALDWMLPAPAQGAIMVVCREQDDWVQTQCAMLNDEATAACVKAERDFLSALMGGCSTPISALAEWVDGQLCFKGNILSPDGNDYLEHSAVFSSADAGTAGIVAAEAIKERGAASIVAAIKAHKQEQK
ncbi:hydroxymethylbilane synthase [Taibaiella koreensis]|uniref:hydroxymethylbilane synthase n=1 Tax=Taibaiella koreensis TaxID=1268548 RepID=UPI000E59E796|nr:hydroxymethylbilane synthase [Taibaiella koreensis]